MGMVDLKGNVGVTFKVYQVLFVIFWWIFKRLKANMLISINAYNLGIYHLIYLKEKNLYDSFLAENGDGVLKSHNLMDIIYDRSLA